LAVDIRLSPDIDRIDPEPAAAGRLAPAVPDDGGARRSRIHYPPKKKAGNQVLMAGKTARITSPMTWMATKGKMPL
jgi:hypothetical protein